MEVQSHDKIDHQPPPELDKHRSGQQDINQHGRQQQRQQSPLMVIIGHIPSGPDGEEIPAQLDQLLPDRLLDLWRRIATPPAVRAQRGQISVELRQRPRDNHCDCSRQHQPRGTAKGALCNGGETAQVVTRPGLLDGFQRADISGQKRENGDPDPALPGNPQDGPLENPGRGVFGVTGGEKIVIPGAGKVREHDEKRSDTAEALHPLDWLWYQAKSPPKKIEKKKKKVKPTSIHLTLLRGSPRTLGSVGCQGKGGKCSTTRAYRWAGWNRIMRLTTAERESRREKDHCLCGRIESRQTERQGGENKVRERERERERERGRDGQECEQAQAADSSQEAERARERGIRLSEQARPSLQPRGKAQRHARLAERKR